MIKRLSLVRVSGGYLRPSYIKEYEAAAKYINWVTNLPWDKSTVDSLDIAMAKNVLDKNHYGLQSVKQRILEYIAALILNFRNKKDVGIGHAPILAFVGLAGTGKTTLAASISEFL